MLPKAQNDIYSDKTCLLFKVNVLSMMDTHIYKRFGYAVEKNIKEHQRISFKTTGSRGYMSAHV